MSQEQSYVTRQEFKELDDKVDELKNEHTKTKQRVYNVEQKLDRIENNTTWILRLILGAIIMAVLAFILQSPETGITIGGIFSGK
ncbi:hemolysin XhlA family protein [Halobacillus salinus]|uniref:hemolysin XhlA family protein n=1 Tax=Halobacillus salinus TaxID=192814 RepID=UPI0015905E73|nr:hemolysin XhlA family protein [Halobacillus salinus]